MLNEKAKWIWISPTFSQNEYVAFEGSYEYSRGKAILRIAAETDYILYINHRLVSFGQFASYPFEKYYDEIDLSEFSREGSNTLTVTVRYEGVNSATHIDDGGGLIFSLEIDGELALVSDENILCGYDGRYIAAQTRLITPQLGLTSGMRSGTYKADRPSVEVKKTRNIKKRPVKKTVLGDFLEAQPISEGSRIYDLGREEAGYLKIKLRSPYQASVKVVYGEHLADKEVRYLIGKRDFSVDIEADSGEEEFILLFLRIAARYLQVYAPDKTEILSIGLLPSRYPLTEKPFALTGLDKEIYDTSIRTLRLCMNTHYEDCPWREQALYVLDSRNQMLCGYYAFEETEFQRENLKFIAKGTREDGFLELTYPAVNTPAIPFFSVMYPVAVYEYIEHTGDRSILDNTLDVILDFMNKLYSRIDESGLIPELEPPFWNFYEWTEGSSGKSSSPYHLILNAAFVYSCERLSELCRLANRSFGLDTAPIRKAIEKEFFNPEMGIFTLSPNGKTASQLGNAFALLIGLGDERTKEALKCSAELIPATLSMLPFIYDALLLCDCSAKDFILRDIREKYGYMLREGATTFWETIEGESAFSRAGSLCHGWSAIPIYYYNIFRNGK